ncbi:hypothetical protein [Methylomagnum ishizawai]|uniref:hypothetical protein n=1 Tax=Methylomagnum ishizawai TaxID=1760988 RepID=UPI001C341B54|nr:hypothetical protein [Methylomagnum ishizawai]BBL76191.1 hypothetical protein MishRS11D_32890 [Methylomagnum ishizawai]
MTESSKDLGIATALLTRFTTQRLPKALALKDKVDQGGKLDEWDIAFLREVFADAEQIMPMVDRHPEYQALCAQAVSLYHTITERALANEQTPG